MKVIFLTSFPAANAGTLFFQRDEIPALTLSEPGGILFAIPLSKLIANVFLMAYSISKPDGFLSLLTLTTEVK